MKKYLFLGVLLSLGITTFVSAADCVNPINPLTDPLVGPWSGSLSIPALGFTGPVNYSFHAGNTLHGQGAQCIGYPIVPLSKTGNLFTTCTGSWSNVSGSYKILYTDVGVNPTVITVVINKPIKNVAVLPTTIAGRTGFFSSNFSLTDCDNVVITGKIALYDQNDPTLRTPLVGPFDANLVLTRVKF